jgi:type IV secretory pathway VirB3-like protein
MIYIYAGDFLYLCVHIIIYQMKILLEIKDSKAAFFMELLKSFSFVKAEPISNDKASFLKELKEAPKK